MSDETKKPDTEFNYTAEDMMNWRDQRIAELEKRVSELEKIRSIFIEQNEAIQAFSCLRNKHFPAGVDHAQAMILYAQKLESHLRNAADISQYWIERSEDATKQLETLATQLAQARALSAAWKESAKFYRARVRHASLVLLLGVYPVP